MSVLSRRKIGFFMMAATAVVFFTASSLSARNQGTPAAKTSAAKTPVGKTAPSAAARTVDEVAEANPVRQPGKTLLPDIVAEVNGEKITKETLASESLRIHGADVLEKMLHRALVLAECKRKQVHVTKDDVEAEINRLAKSTRLKPEEFLQMIEEQSGMTPQEYSDEVIWPKLALETLVADQIAVSDEELEREYLKRFGPSVGMQMIAVKTKEEADAILAEVKAAPDTFGEVAKNKSIDLATAANKGRMQPVFHYTTPDPKLEETFFAMNPGDISDIIGPFGPAGEFLIFRCENKYDEVVPREKIDQIKEKLRSDAANQKLKGTAAALFEKLGREAKTVNVLGDPELTKQYPNVAALVNGQPIYLNVVIEKCLDLYAKADLEVLIHFTLIRQECKKVNLTISDQDVQTEIWINASETTLPLKDGSPNIPEYLKKELALYNVPEAVYRSNIVWPGLAIKKLSEPLVKVTEEDLKKGYEANFGETIQCLGIVVKDQRLAQDIWQKARTLPDKTKRPVEEVFGDLAAQYSVEPGSRQTRGQIAPINKNGGIPDLEEEAFGLKPGELSSIIQVDRETFVILYCQERIPAKDVSFEEAKETIATSVRKKKEVMAAQDYIADVLKRSAINNYLTGQSISQKTKTLPQGPAGATPTGTPKLPLAPTK